MPKRQTPQKTRPITGASQGVDNPAALAHARTEARVCSHYRKASMMRAKTMNPRKSTSSFSKREKRRRNPCNRRSTRAIALRRVDSSRADAQGLTRVRRGGPTGGLPQCHGQVPRLGARGRPVPQHRGRSGGRAQASPQLAARRGGGAGPGERAQASAGRSSAAPLGLVGGHPPRERPRD